MPKHTHTIDEALDAEIAEEGLHKEGPTEFLDRLKHGQETTPRGVEHLPEPVEEKRQGSVNTQDQGEENEDDVDSHEAEDLIEEEMKKQHVEE